MANLINNNKRENVNIQVFSLSVVNFISFFLRLWGQKLDKVNFCFIFMFLRDRDRALLASAG